MLEDASLPRPTRRQAEGARRSASPADPEPALIPSLPHRHPARRPNRPGRRLLALSAVTGLVGALLAFGLLLQRYGSERDRTVEDLQTEAGGLAKVVEAELMARVYVLQALATSPAVLDFDVPRAQALLDSLDPELAGFTGSVALIDGDGTLVARKGGLPENRDVSDRDYVRAVLEGGGPYVSAAVTGRVDRRQLVIVAVPVRAGEGPVDGLLIGSMDVGDAESPLFQLGDAEGLHVVDRSGQLIAGTVPSDAEITEEGLPLAKNAALVADARSRLRTLLVDTDGIAGDGGRVVAAARIDDADWVVLLDRSVGNVLGAARTQLLLGSAVTVGALLTLLAAGAIAARRTDRAEEALDRERAAQQARLDRVHDVSVALGDMVSTDEVAAAFRSDVISALGAHGGSIHLTAGPDEPLRLLAAPNRIDADLEEWVDVPRTISAPIGDVTTTGEAVFLADPAAIRARYPHLEDSRRAHQDGAWASLPLLRSGTVIGVVVYAFAQPQPFDAIQRSEIDAITTRLAHALDRVQLFQAQLDARAQAEELHELSAALGGASTTKEVATAAAHRLAAGDGVVGVLIGLLDPSATQLELTGASAPGAPPGPPLPSNLAVSDSVAMTRSARDGSAYWFRDEAEWQSVSPGGAGYFAASSARAVTVLPLLTRGRPAGALAVLFARPQRFDSSQRDQLTAVAAHCSEALQRAQLFDDAQHRAITLQRHLLPETLPRCPGLRYAVRYKPATDSLVAGGDWYDVILRTDGSAVVIVGDVVGHGAGAAAIMGQLRAVSHALAVDREPAEVLLGLDQYATELAPAMLATVAVVAFDPGRRTVDYALAGHPPPLVVDPRGGTPRWLREATSPPIGVGGGRRAQARAAVVSGSTLVCYTDGLVERRDRTIDVGMDQLAELLSEHNDDVEDLAARLLRTLAPHAPDDVAVIAVRITGGARPAATLREAAPVVQPA